MKIEQQLRRIGIAHIGDWIWAKKNNGIAHGFPKKAHMTTGYDLHSPKMSLVIILSLIK
jgi:hypothetical protein